MTLESSLRAEAAALRERADALEALADSVVRAPSEEPAARAGEYFTWREVCVTGTGLPNDPGPTERTNLRELCRVILDPLRRHLKKPIRITSGYRSPVVNTRVGGSARSQHVKGQAADVMVAGMTSEEVARQVLALQLPFDQMIGYDDKPHLHLSYKPRPRRQTLWQAGGVYEPWRL